MSSEGFELSSESLDQILTVLESYTCSSCWFDEVSEDYFELTTSEQIEELLRTPCGAEFLFDESKDDPYKRQWWAQEKLGGYLVNLRVNDYEINEFIDRIHWEESVCSVDLLRTTVNRLQRKMVDVIFPLYRGRFDCDWSY
tara:strand:+ start:82010 stop:82432 length:423 start_codon:yes stop_codon:yes gene_type:complete